jgi:hypothetical protein
MTAAKKQLAVSFSAMLGLTLSCASQSLPVPEYFGTYAVIEGHLLKLDGKEVRPGKFATVRFGQRSGVGEVVSGGHAASPAKPFEIGVFPADLKIIIFGESAGTRTPVTSAKSLHLDSLVFVRNVTINTGWPSNKVRTDAENGWDTGDPVELAGLARNSANDLELLMKPVPGQKDMIVVGLAEKLKAGVYRLNSGPANPMTGAAAYLFFVVEPLYEAEKIHCVDAQVTYAGTLSSTKYTECSGPPLPSAGEQSPQNPAAGAASSTSSEQPTTAGNYATVGNNSLTAGNVDQAYQMWDKALELGGTLQWRTCHERSMDCEDGMFLLSSREISFSSARGKTAFTVPLTDAQPSSPNVLRNPMYASAYFRLKISGKNYNFDFWPDDSECGVRTFFVICPDTGFRQQVVVGNYILRKIVAARNKGQ